jgi:hypothetical protein
MEILSRRYPSGSTRRNFLKGAGALGLTLAAGAGRARGQAASVVVINEDGSVSTNPTGAATFIAPTSCVVSSLETGEVIQVTAWGGDEFGYAYKYKLSGAPANVNIDSDMGRIDLVTALAVGDYTFNIVVTNRENTSLSVSFPFTLHVLQGITTGTPTTVQILHATFDPYSGTWGSPSGNNWSSVFTAMKTAIIALQTRCNAVHDESLRVFIPLRRGVTYQYNNDLGNQWPTGIQYLQVYATGSGALPIIQNTINDGPGWTDVYNDGPLNIGNRGGGLGTGPGALSHPLNSGNPPTTLNLKQHCARIATVPAGATTVTLLSASDAPKIVAGRWHMVMGWCISFTSSPPNVQFVDYVKVTGVSGTTVSLDRPLKYGYDQTWWENSNENNFGAARLVPTDTGGAGGYIPTDPRCFIRQKFTSIDIRGNPNGPPHTNIAFVGSGIDFTFDGCNVPNAQLSTTKHFTVRNVTATDGWEPDKVSETLLIDGGTTAPYGPGPASGFQYLLTRNHHAGLMTMSPRQWRSKGTWHDGSADGTASVGGEAIGCPITWGYDGPVMYCDFGSDGACQFSHGLDNHWAYPWNGASAALNLGRDATWSGNQLRIPVTKLGGAVGGSMFEAWVAKTYPGAIVSTSAAPPHTSNWGYVASASSPRDGSALWLNIIWVNGTKPSKGALYLNRFRRLYFAQANVLNSGCIWGSPGFEKETAPTREAGWGFPTELPGQYET